MHAFFTVSPRRVKGKWRGGRVLGYFAALLADFYASCVAENNNAKIRRHSHHTESPGVNRGFGV